MIVVFIAREFLLTTSTLKRNIYFRVMSNPSSLSGDIVFALTNATLMQQATATIGQNQTTSPQHKKCIEVFLRITHAATHGNKAALACLNFYLDEAKRLNAMRDNMMMKV